MKLNFKKVVKKPIEVEAFKVTREFIESFLEMTIAGNKLLEDGTLCAYVNHLYVKNNKLYIKTLEGDMGCIVGDYIIRGIKGELYPCRKDIFKLTYNFEEKND